MEEKREKRIRMLTLAFGIALMPPIWAVLSPYMGISTGAVALICAGLRSEERRVGKECAA